MQSFLQAVLDHLPKPPEPEPATPAPAAAAAPADGDAAAGDAAAMETEDGAAPAAAGAPAPAARAPEANGNAPAAPAMDPVRAERLTRLRGILSGATPAGLTLEFLYHNNHADLQVGRARGPWGLVRGGEAGAPPPWRLPQSGRRTRGGFAWALHVRPPGTNPARPSPPSPPSPPPGPQEPQGLRRRARQRAALRDDPRQRARARGWVLRGAAATRRGRRLAARPPAPA
jgi:hypothetical protein